MGYEIFGIKKSLVAHTGKLGATRYDFMNITTYLNRIKCPFPISLDLETLQLLQKSHLLHVPFENLDIHYPTPIILDIEKIYQKIVLQNRGGFCYELNGLFFELLTALGYQGRRISARVYSDTKKAYGQEYDHLAIIVTLDDIEYLVDVGFGEFAFAPLKIKLGEVQEDERGLFVIKKYDNKYLIVNNLTTGKAVPEYIFQTKASAFSEFEGMCHYQQTSPESHFTKKRMITRPIENGRITISGNVLKIKKGKEVKEILLKDEEGFREVLWEYFGIEL